MFFSNAEKIREKGKSCQSHGHHVLAGQSPFTHPDGDQTSLNQQFNICTLCRITRTSQSQDSFIFSRCYSPEEGLFDFIF